MMSWLPVIFLVVVAVVTASDVLEFTDSDFATKIAEHDTVLVEFFAPWCGHCKKLAPEYEKAATKLKHEEPPVPLAKVDCVANKDTCSQFGVSGYPTLKIFRNGEVSQDYQGGREADGIVKYMKSQTGAASKEIKTVDEMRKFLDNFEHGIIGFFESDTEKLYTTFKKVSESLREDYRFAHTFSEEVAKEFQYENDIVIARPPRLNNKFEEDKVKYTGDNVVHKVKTFISEYLHGLVGHRTNSNVAQFKKPLVVVYYETDYIKNPKGSNYWRNRVMKVAQNYKDKIVYFGVSNVAEFRGELDEFGLTTSGDGKPVVAARNALDEKFTMADEFSPEALTQFVDDFLANNLEPYLKSEPVPESNEDPVKVVVARNFDEIVNNNEKDVLVEFYAPWCGHCKKLAPVFDELGEKVKDEHSLTIAKMDATGNDVPSPYSVQGFPTLYFAPKNKKTSPLKYEGGREVDDFIKYLSKHSTDGLQGWDKSGRPKNVEL